jgi:hypothetical protein
MGVRVKHVLCGGDCPIYRDNTDGCVNKAILTHRRYFTQSRNIITKIQCSLYTRASN